ncbi:MAG: 4-hydroxythreonine-4-phosphate dehydrogenase PdxA [Gammaproteobacteria bacterium]|nr:4-hydroxythreonine-4-phosphate dehydrogenase PdxA [Gammaproteobacteria bacterium]MBT4788636.1 4-hydroxythreonine-4-phosphate dehydrogenase PdxA [Gammaproteobacteria bacterium]MBT7480186.1 4-hydroxythreonine-4-phosphate dehydrogenase PdxA [Gammaproteobacteria bacterium]
MRLAFTPGEPAGIGPDLAVQIAQSERDYDLIAFADPELLQQRAQQLGLPLKINVNSQHSLREAGALTVHPIPLQAAIQPGVLNPNSAAYVLETIRTATDACLDQQYHALVTGPIHKGVINQAGKAGLICRNCGPRGVVTQIPFSGHTEYLQQLCETDEVVMMLVIPEQDTSQQKPLRVALVTTHLPLNEVAAAITTEKLTKIITTLHQGLITHCGLSHPSLLVAGLNPHAGEGGHLGTEEIEVITPVINQLRQQGIDLQGPIPADTLFTPPILSQGDAVLAMYHDQGLPVLKHNGFGRAVNITLGLPFLRTSVDHGTALDLAGTGRANLSSLQQAIAVAQQV